MTPGFPLNTAHAHTWAAVVSGTAWKRHTLEDGGTLTAEYVRGPVIVWASTGLKGYFKSVTEAVAKGAANAESAPRLTLEEHIDHLNTAQVFERFRWAARGKVRHSVRWKTGTRRRRLRKLEALADLRYAAIMTERRAAGNHGFMGHSVPRTAKTRREAQKFCEAERFKDRLRSIFPNCTEIECDGKTYLVPDIDVELLKIIQQVISTFKAYKVSIERYGIDISFEFNNLDYGDLLPDALRYALITGDTEALAGIVASVKARRRNQLLSIVALHSLRAAEYRAHLTRRIKPAPRRDRTRRPLYARPRPPSAPLAPPVI